MDFTYEKEDRQDQYETYEWDNTWIDHADVFSAKRVLYIGDSISCGTRRLATMQTEEKILFDGFGTSKALDNPYFKECIEVFAKQQKERIAVIFNNGLHGFHLSDETAYKEHYEDMIRFLLSKFENTPVIIALTTHIRDEEREKRVICRNRVATEIANKYALPIIDLYKVSLEGDEWISDGVHMVTEGYEKLAEEIVRAVRAVCGGV